MANAICFENSPSSSVSHLFSVPTLTENDTYHVFMSFSAADSAWVHRLIQKLEATFPSIKICTHDREFTAGKTIIENMTESIQSCQKIVMVLSPDFVRSRWCLFEANLSMFQDCMSHKVIVPVMLKPCPMPLYLSHLTYLEVEDEQFFQKLCNRLLKNNAKENDDVMVHFQTSILYGGKHLLSLAAVNENDEEAGYGKFSNTCVPDSLKAVVKDPELYKKAIQLINDTPNDFLKYKLTIYFEESSLVFVSLKKCRDIFQINFEDDTELAESMWRKAMIKYSSDYANCMAKKYFPCNDPQPPGHLPNGICFCQYVAMQIQQGDWP
ncbi:uncharacterized protein RB166_005814 [Leptodactylus fuscus]